MITFFIPKSKDCEVRFTWNLLSEYNLEGNRKVLIENNTPKVDNDLYTSDVAGEQFYKDFVFAHGLPDGSALVGEDGELIDGDWWVTNGATRIGVFHVCYGARFLSLPENSELFHDWLSYGDKLYMFINDRQQYAKVSAFWRELFIDMINVINTKSSIINIRAEFESIYRRGLAKLDKFSKGDLGELTKIHIIFAMNAMVSKYDRNKTN